MFQRAAEIKRPPRRVAKAPQPGHKFMLAHVIDNHGRERRMTLEAAKSIGAKKLSAIHDSVRERRVTTARRAEQAEFRRMVRSLHQEELEAEMRNRALWRAVRIKAPLEKQQRASGKGSAAIVIRSSRAMPKYSGPVLDRMKRRGVFVRVRYWSAKHAKAGVALKGVGYIWTGALEDEAGRIFFECNVAANVEEAMAAFDLLEQINRAGAGNAKIAFHAIMNVPFELDVGSMMTIGREFAEDVLGSRGLPYALALHPPSADGDERNWHLHLIFSTRPMVRTGDHQWDVGDQLRTEVDNQEAFARMREIYADVQTEVTQAAGLNHTYTALSNAARGLPTQPQIHLGPTRTAMVRRGAEVAANDVNFERSISGEAALLDEQLRHRQEAADREAAILAAAQNRANAIVALAPASISRPMHANVRREPMAALESSTRGTAQLSDVAMTSAPVQNTKLRSPPVPSRRDGIAAPVTAAVSISKLAPGLIARGKTMAVQSLIGSSHVSRVAEPPLSLPLLSPFRVRSLPQASSSRRLHASGYARVVPASKSADRTSATVLATKLSASTSIPIVPPAGGRLVAAAKLLSRGPLEISRDHWPSSDGYILGEIFARQSKQRGAAARRVEMSRAEEGQMRNPAVRSRLAELDQLQRMDPWVVAPISEEPFKMSDQALAFLGRDRAWLESATVQRRLLAMATTQQDQVDAMLHTLTWSDGQLTIKSGDKVAAARVRRWSTEPDFIQYVESLRPALRAERERAVKRRAAQTALDRAAKVASSGAAEGQGSSPFDAHRIRPHGHDPGLN
jgi:hypothetical protein